MNLYFLIFGLEVAWDMNRMTITTTEEKLAVFLIQASIPVQVSIRLCRRGTIQICRTPKANKVASLQDQISHSWAALRNERCERSDVLLLQQT